MGRKIFYIFFYIDLSLIVGFEGPVFYFSLNKCIIAFIRGEPFDF